MHRGRPLPIYEMGSKIVWLTDVLQSENREFGCAFDTASARLIQKNKS